MNTLFVTYKLTDNDAQYPCISSKLKSYPEWAKVLPRCWIIRTKKASKTVRSELSDIIGGNGKVLVINITDSAWASYGLDDDINEWMRENV